MNGIRPETMVMALGVATAVVLLGEWIRLVTPGLRRVALPGAVLGGVLALLAGPQVLLAGRSPEWVEQVYDGLAGLPPMFITVVFACLMLGRRMDGVRSVWRRARRQVVMGHVFAWGQYVVGLSLVLLVLRPLFDVDRLAGTVIAIGFQGGHGTAAGLGESFRQLGFAEGKTVAYALATFGIIAGAVFGPLLGSALARRHPVEVDECPEGQDEEMPDSESDGESESGFSALTGKLTVHLALVAAVIAAGWRILRGAQAGERALRGGDGVQLVSDYVPLFSVVLIVGFAAQLLLQAAGVDRWFERRVFKLVSGFALDMVIAGALATLGLATFGEYWEVILILFLGGMAWNLAVFFGLGPRIYPSPWFAYGLGDLGGGTATTASGLLLIRVVDPQDRTDARRVYSEKQPFYEPLMGGGLVTAFALPTVAALGAAASLAVTGAVLGLWLVLAIVLIRRK